MRKQNIFRLTVALFVVFGLLITTGVMAAEKKTRETIQGMVEAGNKGTAAIKTDDGQAFLILGQNLAPKTVKVTGTLSKGKTTRSIIVTSFEEVQD